MFWDVKMVNIEGNFFKSILQLTIIASFKTLRLKCFDKIFNSFSIKRFMRKSFGPMKTKFPYWPPTIICFTESPGNAVIFIVTVSRAVTAALEVIGTNIPKMFP